jgi:hypothetical protein
MEDNVTAGTFLPQTPYTSSPQGNYIQSSQAFFVERASPGPASIAFDETNKSSNYTPLLFRPVTGKNTARIRSILLVVQGDKSTILADGNLAEFSTDYTNDVDIRDAFKFTNIHENLGLKRDGKILSIERRTDVVSDDTLFFDLTKATPRNYRLQLICENMNPLLSAILEIHLPEQKYR